MNPRTILFPTDFSGRADKALVQAIAFGKQFDDRFIIYHTYHRPVEESKPHAGSEQLLRHAEEAIDSKFQGLLRRHPDLRDLNYEFKKELGISVDNIINFAEQEEIDLITMATKGARGFGEIWGTKTARIIKSVAMPVLVIPDGTRLDRIGKIGLACDYSQQTDYQSLSFLVEVAEKLRLDIDIITLNREEKTMTRQELINRDRIVEQLNSRPVSISFTFNTNIEEGIISYCQENAIGLIAVLPKSYTFIEWLFHESLTQKMAFHSPLPLLVLK